MDDASAGTWESGSEISASVVSGSSVWTEGSNPTDRSSRRKLILQMAKARMKSNKDGLSPTSGACSADVKAHAIPEEGGLSENQALVEDHQWTQTPQISIFLGIWIDEKQIHVINNTNNATLNF
jgi:hypothetical protein